MTTTCNLPQWAPSLAAMTVNVKAYVRQCKRQGTVGMSYANLRQCVSTKGCTVPVALFDSLLTQAIADAGVRSFVV